MHTICYPPSQRFSTAAHKRTYLTALAKHSRQRLWEPEAEAPGVLKAKGFKTNSCHAHTRLHHPWLRL
jgi:hypothetical protein